MSETRTSGFDRLWLEIGALTAVLMAGAVLRFWLSTVLPFDAGELAWLEEATIPERSGRVPFIMINGVFLFFLYITVRRSAGPAVAFAVLLLLQTSLTYQNLALRIWLWAVPLLVLGAAVTYFRLQRPPWQAPRKAALAAAVLATALGVRGLYIMATLPGRLEAIRQETTADVQDLYASLGPCGGEPVMSLERFRRCDPRWPETRSLDQQEALLEHRVRLGTDTLILKGDTVPWAELGPRSIVFDPAAAAFLAVAPGEATEIAARVVRAESPQFFAELGLP